MRNINRRGFVASLAGTSLVAIRPAGAQPAAQPAVPPRFGFDDVVRRARDLSTAPVAPSPPLPDALARLDIDTARDIRFRPERALLAGPGSQFRLQAIHLDPQTARPVTVNIIRDGIATPIPYAAGLFDYGRAKFDKPLPLNLGFAGFRLQFPQNDPRAFDDSLMFTGSSQFRFIGRGQRAGASPRAITVNTGQDNEEFPFFREFWIETPDAGAERATVYALLDGDSVTGAFRFEVAPGADATLDVTATLFPRRVGGVLGLAPLGSMFLVGESDRRLQTDYRREVHSSDGLSLLTGAGEWVWRPLRNPEKGGRFAFMDQNPKGFGLMQRDRDFGHYEDLHAGFERRPSYWVETIGDWGEGRVELVELPATDDRATNVFAAWVASEPRDPGKPINIAYRILACIEARRLSPGGRAAATFQTTGPAENVAAAAARRFLIDFSGGDLGYFLGDPATVEVAATAANGRVIQAALTPNPFIQGFRATVDVEATPGRVADIRMFLRAGGRTLTETWTMPWSGVA